jgi:ankyrin repeat protein
MVKVLLEAGVEVNVRDIYGFSALNRALDLRREESRNEVVEMLEAKGAKNLY